MFRLLSRFLTFGVAALVCTTASAADSFVVPKDVAKVLTRRCIKCHSGDSAEGNVRFDTLLKLKNDERLELLNKAQEQLYFQRMPPEDEEQPTDLERKSLSAWFSTELRKFNASKLEEKLQKPEYGNYVDHEKLFSGDYANLPGFTFDRRWLISESSLTRSSIAY